VATMHRAHGARLLARPGWLTLPRTRPAACAAAAAHPTAPRLWPATRSRRCLAVRDVGIRERTLWRLPDETAARASEVLALDVGEPDLVNRCAKVCRKGNATAAGANFS